MCHSIGGCDQEQLGTPQELALSLSRSQRALGTDVPIMTLDFLGDVGQLSKTIQSLESSYSDSEVVLVKVRMGNLHEKANGGGRPRVLLTKMVSSAYSKLGAHIQKFSHRCSDITDMPHGQCNNICS